MAFFDPAGGLKLALWPRMGLAHDSGVPLSPTSATQASLGHNVASREAVDAAMAQAGRVSGRLVKPAAETFWGGYAG